MHPNDRRVISNFIVQALKGESITIYGDSSQTRSFCYVDDLIEDFVRLMNSPKEITAPVNLGNLGEITIKKLAELAIEMTGSKSKLSFLPLPDPRQRQPDIPRAQETLGWVPKVSLADGFWHTIVYFDNLLSQQAMRSEERQGSPHD